MGTESKPGRKLSREEILAQVKMLARKRKVRALSRSDLQRAGIHYRQVIRHFGSHNTLIEACGLVPRPTRESVPDETLLTAMHATFTKAGGFINGERFDRICGHGRGAYKSRWRSWARALQAYRAWLRRHRLDFPRIAELKSHGEESGKTTARPTAWQGCGGARLGAPLAGGTLQHAPTNEMGVVLLFGALAPSLGYLVETVGTAFPDCLAKRRLQGSDEPWERVRIEFEYKSRNFLKHKHQAKQCDVIVCWENDWPNCPIEVLELKKEIGEASPHPLALARDPSHKGRG